MRILIVDDDEGIREVLREECEIRGIHAETSGDGLEALRIMLCCQGERIDLIVLDLMMPKMNGYEVLRIKNQFPEIASIPVVIITAQQASLDPLTGAGVVVAKPFSFDVISRIIEKFYVDPPPPSEPEGKPL